MHAWRIQDQDWSLITRSNEEIDFLIKHADIITYINAPRIRLIGKILRTHKERAAKIIAERKPNQLQYESLVDRG